MAWACSLCRGARTSTWLPQEAIHLLLVEHEHTFTYGPHANLAEHLRCTPEEVGAELIAVDRGGDITYHGPGQPDRYPILSLAAGAGPLRHVLAVEGPHQRIT